MRRRLPHRLSDPSGTYGDGAAYAVGITLCGFAIGLLHHQFFFRTWSAGMRTRMAITGMIMGKSLNMRLEALMGTTIGQVWWVGAWL